MSIKSPYNFVPAPTETEVFTPDWANQVSHDIPFSDGESGEIELKITAITPIFIRNGHSKASETNEFSNYYDKDGKQHFFIPGSSLKGMFRNVLEIMSFSRLNKNLVNNDRYSFRDLSKSGNLYLSKYKEFKINGGWLNQNSDGSWVIEECDEIAFIHHSELEKKDFPFKEMFLFQNPPTKEGKTAKFKYDKTKSMNLNLVYKFKTITKQLFGNVSRNMAFFSEDGRIGTIVFSGQSGQRKEYDDLNKKPSGKVHEFVFFHSDNPQQINVNLDMQKDFKFIYLDHDKNNISPDWKFWRNNFLEKGEKVPVFYSKDNNGNLSHFGLAYMYKLPYKNSIYQMHPIKDYNTSGIDLANLIFGFTNSKKEDSLKGRVMIGHALMQNNVIALTESKEIFGNPKASYYPYYLEQNIENEKVMKYKTYEDNAVLRGFKRYPLHNKIKKGEYDEKQLKNDKIFSKFYPLPEGSEFKCKIRYHNLRKFEIGALLAAITFNNQKKCFHNLGAAKPYGYGKIKIEISDIILNKNEQSYLDLFIEKMIIVIKNWEKSPALKELFAMASNQNDKILIYPEIEEFVQMKHDQDLLVSFSEISQPKPEIIDNRPKEGEAIVTLISGQIIQARLIEGKDINSKNLIINQGNKPRKGDKIRVKIIYKGGNIDKFEFISIIR